MIFLFPILIYLNGAMSINNEVIMTDKIQLKEESLPSTNNPWGFGGAKNKTAFVIVGEISDNPDESWVYGEACTRHGGVFPFVRKRNLNIDSAVGSKNSAKKYIANYYNKKGIKVDFIA